MLLLVSERPEPGITFVWGGEGFLENYLDSLFTPVILCMSAGHKTDVGANLLFISSY